MKQLLVSCHLIRLHQLMRYRRHTPSPPVMTCHPEISQKTRRKLTQRVPREKKLSRKLMMLGWCSSFMMTISDTTACLFGCWFIIIFFTATMRFCMSSMSPWQMTLCDDKKMSWHVIEISHIELWTVIDSFIYISGSPMNFQRKFDIIWHRIMISHPEPTIERSEK